MHSAARGQSDERGQATGRILAVAKHLALGSLLWLGLAIVLGACAALPPESEPAPEPEQLVVLEPELSIHALRLLRHDLVNVRLALVVEIHNPNPFPLDLHTIDYEFWGEGRYWNSGSLKPELSLAPASRQRLNLPINLNFTDMDRRVFELVARQRRLQYRLSGTALLSSHLEQRRDLALVFDKSGSIQVE